MKVQQLKALVNKTPREKQNRIAPDMFMVSGGEYQIFFRITREDNILFSEASLATKTLNIRVRVPVFEFELVKYENDDPDYFPCSLGVGDKMGWFRADINKFEITQCLAMRQTDQGAQSYVDPEEVENELMLLILTEI